MKIIVIIPDRGDRPKLMENCLRMIAAQTLQPVHVHVMGWAPDSEKCDITQRYRKGYEAASGTLGGLKADVIAFLENDDWYAPDYLEIMARTWDFHGRPEIFGTNYTLNYHLRLRRYFTMEHYDRASAMNTFIKPRLKINWPIDSEPYTDLHLWMHCNLRGITFRPARHISVSMKHGEGKSGGDFHTTELVRFSRADEGFLKQTVDAESFEFYDKYFEV